ncbi:DUF7010 family protein [Maricaulis maris]|uniref:DUF7010 family protein n=1 Tax=Maricaulis maris TaxID=74318 RepID=UPI003A9327E8
MTDLSTQFLNERRRYSAAAGGGVSLPVAGAVYWAGLAIAGLYMDPTQWAYMAAMFSGAIFPLGILLQGVFKSPFMKAKSPVSGVTTAAIVAINLLWPIHMIVIWTAPQAAPLTLAIGMALHWPIIGWGYASRVCMIHAIVRVAAVTVIFFGLPEISLVAIPVVVSGLYLLAAAGLSWESNRFRRMLAMPGQVPG